MSDKISKTDRAIAFVSLWIARLAGSVLMFVGLMHLLGGIDPVIAYPVSFLGVAFLVKETL